MTLRQLKWSFLGTLLVLFVFVEYARYQFAPFLDSWSGRLAMDLVVVVAALFFFGFTFDLVARMKRRLGHQNRELLALHHAALDIYGDLTIDSVLQKVVDQARQLLEARYGAMSVVDDDGAIRQFITSGITADERARIGPPPEGHGLLGVVLTGRRHLRLADVRKDSRFKGFPAHHPPMAGLLAVPILCRAPLRGNLYLANGEAGREFSAEDEESLTRFATAAAIAIDNAYLHEQLQSLAVAEERLRIAREMHDGMAQILAYVNTKAQAVQGFLGRGKTEVATEHLEQLAAAAREVYTDVREEILALRTEVGPDRPLAAALADFLDRWQTQSGVRGRLTVADDLELDPMVELQLLRIVQEALSNVRKHSGAAEASVAVAAGGGRLEAVVADDGRGFDRAAARGENKAKFGLDIMRERAESIGGQLTVASSPGRGTRITVAVPLTNGP